MDEQIAAASKEVIAELGGLKPELAIILVLMFAVVAIVWLLTRRPAVQDQGQNLSAALKIGAEAATDLSASNALSHQLQVQLGDIRVEMTKMQSEIAQLREQNKALVAAQEITNKKLDVAEAQNKSLQLALDTANKKLDALNVILAAKEQREGELTKENMELRKQIEALGKQIDDLQFQLNQFLKLPEFKDEVFPDPVSQPDAGDATLRPDERTDE